MGSIKKQKEIISLLAENEEAVSNLYRLYAEKFPYYRDFWLKLAKEELEHADLIRTLFLYSKRQQDIFIRDIMFNTGAIKWVINYTKNVIQEAKIKEYDIVHALSLALDIENSLVEKKLFQLFEGDDPKLQNTLKYLEKSSESHKTRIKDLWAIEKEKEGQDVLTTEE
jgi:hypothetical protein